MSNYRQIIHVAKIDLCNLLKDTNANLFIRQPISQLIAAYPNIDFKCPITVNTIIYFILFNI